MAGDSRRRRPLAAAVLATSVATLASCSLVTSFDGYVGSDDASSPIDSSPPGTDGADGKVAPDSWSPGTDSSVASDADAQSRDSTVPDAGDAASGDAAPVDGAGQDTGADSPATTIEFVQAATASPLGAPSSVSVTFAQPQNAGDLVVVAAGWTTSGNANVAVMSIGDSSGNGYATALAATHISAGLAQALYYARGVKAAPAGANTVTVTFPVPVGVPQVLAAEYAGLDPVAPFDTSAGFGGRSTTASSGVAATATAPELVFGAGYTQGSFTGAGALFTLRNLSGLGTGVIEDRVVDAPGTYSADAPLTSSAYYIMQMAAFR